MKVSQLVVAAAVTGILAGCGAVICPSQACAAESSDVTKNMEKHDCKGLNSCKAKGGCKVEGKHDCAGMNSCKGHGGCATDHHDCKGKNACKGKGKGGKNECKGMGACATPKAK
jgi:hypothetical protein